MNPTTPVTRREPALIVGVVVGVISGASTFLSAWGAGQDVRVAAAAGLGVLATAVAGSVVVRSQVFSPSTANEIMDAHAVIHGVERGED